MLCAQTWKVSSGKVNLLTLVFLLPKWAAVDLVTIEFNRVSVRTVVSAAPMHNSKTRKRLLVTLNNDGFTPAQQIERDQERLRMRKAVPHNRLELLLRIQKVNMRLRLLEYCSWSFSQLVAQRLLIPAV